MCDHTRAVACSQQSRSAHVLLLRFHYRLAGVAAVHLRLGFARWEEEHAGQEQKARAARWPGKGHGFGGAVGGVHGLEARERFGREHIHVDAGDGAFVVAGERMVPAVLCARVHAVLERRERAAPGTTPRHRCTHRQNIASCETGSFVRVQKLLPAHLQAHVWLQQRLQSACANVPVKRCAHRDTEVDPRNRCR